MTFLLAMLGLSPASSLPRPDPGLLAREAAAYSRLPILMALSHVRRSGVVVQLLILYESA